MLWLLPELFLCPPAFLARLCYWQVLFCFCLVSLRVSERLVDVAGAEKLVRKEGMQDTPQQ